MGYERVNPRKIVNTKGGPERQVQDALIIFLRNKGWVVRETHGNLYQHGFPDLYCAHRMYGARWVEVKVLKNGLAVFENSQLEFFPMLASAGIGVWVLTAATEEEYQKLFKPPQWYTFLAISQPGRRRPG